jgi:hypothetical protein
MCDGDAREWAGEKERCCSWVGDATEGRDARPWTWGYTAVERASEDDVRVTSTSRDWRSSGAPEVVVEDRVSVETPSAVAPRPDAETRAEDRVSSGEMGEAPETSREVERSCAWTEWPRGAAEGVGERREAGRAMPSASEAPESREGGGAGASLGS